MVRQQPPTSPPDMSGYQQLPESAALVALGKSCDDPALRDVVLAFEAFRVDADQHLHTVADPRGDLVVVIAQYRYALHALASELLKGGADGAH